jgi:DNA-binding NtrC family response regulator
MPGTAMREVLEMVAKIAPTDAPVLILGEPGTGKESIAREIHRQSRCAAGPFVRVSCGATPDVALDGQLFGRPLTAQTTSETAAGLLASAAGGSLFLHNVGNLPFWAMVKLLDALQQSAPGPFRTSPIAAGDVRVIASDSCNLEAAMAENQFYSALYYYLSVIQIDVPPLRERPEDIREFAAHFLSGAGSPVGSGRRFTAEAWECLLGYSWPGNIRELAAAVARSAFLAEGNEIGQEDVVKALPKCRSALGSNTISVPLSGGLREIERQVVEEVIQRYRGNKAAAAKALGLHRRTLYRLLNPGQDPRTDPRR